MRWRSHFAGDGMSLVHAASATELSRLAVFLNNRLVCVSGLIIANSPSVSCARQLGQFVLDSLKGQEGLSAVTGVGVALRPGNTGDVLSRRCGPSSRRLPGMAGSCPDPEGPSW